MTDEENDQVAMAECGACRAVIPLDSSECPECGTNFSGVSEDALGECGACQALVPLDSTRCPECGVLFVADDVVDILRQWIADTGINIRKLFEKFDENSDGTIDSDELKQGLLSLNLADLPPSQIERLVAEIDADGNGVIDLDEFDQILMGETTEPSEEETTAEDDSESDEDETETAKEQVEEDAEEEQSDEEPAEDAADGEAVDADEDEAEETDEESSDDDTQDNDQEEADSDDEGGMAVVGIDDEDFDLEEEEDVEDEEADEEDEDKPHPLLALAEMMDEHDISAQRLFNELDADGNGQISMLELTTMLAEKYGDVLELEDVDAIMTGVDVDGDGLIDITEFIGSMEELEDHEEAVEAHAPEKEFPTVWQKRMMSKTWNDSVWPILHVGFGLLIAVFLANAMFGIVDGSGGNVAYVPNDSGLIPSGNIQEGDIYPCDEKYQQDGCRNSLTPFAGTNGSLSMPMGFYWDGILLMLLATIGLAASLFLHLVRVPGWRARAKAMREFADDKADAAESVDPEGEVDEESGDESSGEDHVDPDEHDESVDDDMDEDEDEDDDGVDDDEDGDEDAIDIGSHIGLMFDDEEVFGTIIEFDDDEETVTIEEDGTGDLVTGYQEDMFIE